MKKIILLSTIIFNSLISQAAVLTVSNDPVTPAQYTDLQSAHNAASPGDTLIVSGNYDIPSGTGNQYQNLVFSKQLVVIGPGFKPINNGKSAKFVSGLSFAAGSEGSVISGFYFIGIGLGIYANNISIVNSFIATTTGGFTINTGIDSVFFKNNMITSPLTFWGSNNFIFIENNLFIGNGAGSMIANLSNPNCLISNNVFSWWPMASVYAFSNLTNVLIANNIFYGIRSYQPGYTYAGCIFNNNLTYQTNNDTLPPQSATGAGNIIGQDPLFTLVPVPGNINFADDYTLQSTSPGHNAGTDGTDIGMYGGNYPMKDAPITGMSAAPYITIFDIFNSVIQQGTGLDVHFKAYKHD